MFSLVLKRQTSNELRYGREREREWEISLMYFKGFLLYSGHDYRLLHVCCDVCSRKCRENEMKSFFFSSVFSFCVQNFVCVHRFLSLPLPRLGPHDITDREWEKKEGEHLKFTYKRQTDIRKAAKGQQQHRRRQRRNKEYIKEGTKTTH